MNQDAYSESKPSGYKPFNKRPVFGLLIFIVLLFVIPLALFVVSSARKKETTQDQIDYFKASYVPDELIVKLKEEYTKEDLQTLDAKFKELGVIGEKKAYNSDKEYLRNYYVLKFKPGTDLRKVKQEFDTSSLIEVSHPNYVLKVDDVPNDTYYPQQWNLKKIGMEEAWDITRGENVTIAVIDTGIDYNHPDFSGRNILKGPSYADCVSRASSKLCLVPGDDPLDTQGHGTHVAGIIGAVANNARGVAGIAWDVDIMSIKTMGGRTGEIVDVINAMQYAMENGARVINMSLTSDPGTPCTAVPAMQATINDAISRNVVVVGAAGNEAVDPTAVGTMEFPPSCNGIIVVGATDASDRMWPKSNYGPRVDIAAPGSDILSLALRDGYKASSGTSMASPHVAAVAGLIVGANPNITPQEVKNCLVDNADSIQTARRIGPRLNAAKALNACSGKTAANNNTQSATNSSNNSNGASLIKGIVFIDNNNNGGYDSGEPGYQDAKINLEGQINGSTTSDSEGKYSFANLSAGNYKVDVLIERQQVGSSGTFGIPANFAAKISFALPPSFSQDSNATNSTKKNSTPTPKKTYSCKPKSSTTSGSSIQIGGLECSQNPQE